MTAQPIHSDDYPFPTSDAVLRPTPATHHSIIVADPYLRAVLVPIGADAAEIASLVEAGRFWTREEVAA